MSADARAHGICGFPAVGRERPLSGAPGTETGLDLPAGSESGAGDAFAVVTGSRFYLDMPAQPGAVPHARRCTRATLAAWQVGDVADDTELVVSELVTNAVLAHAGSRPASDPGSPVRGP